MKDRKERVLTPIVNEIPYPDICSRSCQPCLGCKSNAVEGIKKEGKKKRYGRKEKIKCRKKVEMKRVCRKGRKEIR